MIAGVLFLASLKSFFTALAPDPTYILSNSDPFFERKTQLASVANALAIIVLPVPGEPTSKIPLGNLAPLLVYFAGYLR